MVDDPIVFAGLMPHAPILVPGVGRERLAEVTATVQSMATVSRRAMAPQVETLVFISPHSPRQPGAFGVWGTRRLRGSLAVFGSPEDRVDLPLDRAFAERLETTSARRGVETWRISGGNLDHGAIVPLCYLVSAGWKGPTVIISLKDDDSGLEELGEAIATTARELNRRTVVIASGDMSHRLTSSAPCGYHPEAHRFDETFIALLRKGAFHDIRRIDASLQEVAAQDVADSTTVALAATGYRTDGHAVLSYEGPFGVGYGVAILFEPKDSNQRYASTKETAGKTLSRFADLPALARCAVETQFRDGSKTPRDQAAGELTERHGVFMTLRTDSGELRGCRGTMRPIEGDLVQETWRNAVATAFQDHRFPPVQAEDLPHLRYSVTVLGDLEPVASPEGLDPAIYGVLVSAADGREGCLLPAIAGIDSVEQQLAIARRKAGIAPDEWIGIQRFKARSFREPHFVEEGG